MLIFLYLVVLKKITNQTTIVIHVDDMMITSTNDKNIDKIFSEIENLYPGQTKTRGKVLIT
jgi:hypothetical protein